MSAADSIDALHRRSWPQLLWAWRYLLLRRLAQFGVLLLFFGSAHWAWQWPGKTPILAGNLSASLLFGVVPMADPFATLQLFLTGHLLQRQVVLGTLIVFGFYALVGGRVFCSWVCPVNMVTDLAGWLRRQIQVPALFHLPRSTRYVALATALALSALSGVAAFEWVSPIGMLQREILFGAGAAGMALLALFLFDLLILGHGWCGHLCPLGAFWAVPGRFALWRVRFDPTTCTHCGECARVCPEPQVLNLKRLERTGYVDSGECSNCGRCSPLCPEGSLAFDLKPLIRRHHRGHGARNGEPS